MTERMTLLLLILVATGESFWNGTIVDQIYAICPFNNFYNRPSDYVRNTSDVFEPCCTACKSEQYCGARVPCCPDYRLQQMTSLCISNVISKLVGRGREIIETFEQHFWMVETCLPTYQGSTLEINCQQRDVFDFVNATQMKPVLDNNTKIIYANQFCAYCNDLNDSIAYDIFLTMVRCFGNKLSFLKPFSDLTSLFEMGLCHYHFMPASFDVISDSACKPYDVTSCNVTGRWKSYDQTIFDACLSYDLSYSSGNNFIIYKNIHCYFCNIADQNRAPELCNRRGRQMILPTFAAILGSPSMTEQTPPADEICSTREFYVPEEEECRDIVCAGTYTMTPEGCRKLLLDIEDMVWSLNTLWTITDGDFLQNIDLEKQITDYAVDFFNNTLFYRYKNVLTLVSQQVYVGETSNESALVLTSSEFLYNTGAETDPVMDFLSRYQGKENTIETHDVNGTMLYLETRLVNADSITRVDAVVKVYQRVLHKSYTYRSSTRFRYVHAVVSLSKLIACDMVHLQDNEYNITDYGALFLHRNELYLSDVEYLRYNDGEGHYVCITDFLYKKETAIEQSQQTQSTTIKSIISVMLFIVSVSGLCLTVVTYMLCKSLHSTTGRLYIFLCITMIISQSLQNFTIDRTEYRDACIVFGIFSHFFSLTTMFWLHVCSLYAVLPRAALKLCLPGCCDKRLCLWCFVYTSMAAALFVCSNVLVSLLHSNMADIGYGGESCKLSTPWNKLYVLIIPSECFILCGMIGLIVGLVKPGDTEASAECSDSWRAMGRKTFMIVSVLASAYLVLQALCMWFASPIMEYLLLVMNAAQGVCLFLAFVVGQPVLALYAKLICPDEPEEF